MKNRILSMSKEEKIDFLRQIFAKREIVSTDELFEVIQNEDDSELLCIMYVVLGKISQEADVLKICKGLKHSSDIVRRHAVIGLGLLRSDYIMTFLFDVLEDKSYKVQKEAYNICKKINIEMLYEYIHFKISQEKNNEILLRYAKLFKDSSIEEEKKIYEFLVNKVENPDFEDMDYLI